MPADYVYYIGILTIVISLLLAFWTWNSHGFESLLPAAKPHGWLYIWGH